MIEIEASLERKREKNEIDERSICSNVKRSVKNNDTDKKTRVYKRADFIKSNLNKCNIVNVIEILIFS